ncbi:hypothetical protein CLU79DRAFT_830189 [Phycomyces nitens]|nr:hypothetical protein CLU79DRAFT_830189 [Phycomyces nitens]
MTYNALTIASQTSCLATAFLCTLLLVVVYTSPLARVLDTLLSALARLSVDNMGMTYSPVLFDDDQDSVEGNCGAKDEETTGLASVSGGSSESQRAPLEGESSGVSLGERHRGIPGLEPFERLFLEAIDSGSVGARIPTTMEELQEQFPSEFNRGRLFLFVGAKHERPACTPVRRDTPLGGFSRCGSLKRSGKSSEMVCQNNWLIPKDSASEREGENSTRDNKYWFKKSFLDDDLEMFSEATWKQGTSAGFGWDSSEAVPNIAEEVEQHDVLNEVGTVHSRVYRNQADEFDEDESSDGESSESLLCSSSVGSLSVSELEETQDEMAFLVARLEALTIDDVNEHPILENNAAMGELSELGSQPIKDHLSVPDEDLMMENLGMEVSFHTVQQAGDVGEEVASGVNPQYDELVGEPFVLGQEAVQGLVPQIEAPMELIDASSDGQQNDLDMDVNSSTKPVGIKDLEFGGLVNASASTAGITTNMNDDSGFVDTEALLNSMLVMNPEVEAVPGFKGNFDSCQDTNTVDMDDGPCFKASPVDDNDKLPNPAMECSSPKGKKLITDKGAVCVPQQTVSDVKGKGKETKEHQFKAPFPVFTFGAGEPKGSKSGLNKPSAPAFVFGSGKAQKCELRSFNVPKLPGLYGVPPPPEGPSKPVAGPSNKARLAKSSEDAKVPDQAESDKSGQEKALMHWRNPLYVRSQLLADSKVWFICLSEIDTMFRLLVWDRVLILDSALVRGSFVESLPLPNLGQDCGSTVLSLEKQFQLLWPRENIPNSRIQASRQSRADNPQNRMEQLKNNSVSRGRLHPTRIGPVYQETESRQVPNGHPYDHRLVPHDSGNGDGSSSTNQRRKQTAKSNSQNPKANSKKQKSKSKQQKAKSQNKVFELRRAATPLPVCPASKNTKRKQPQDHRNGNEKSSPESRHLAGLWQRHTWTSTRIEAKYEASDSARNPIRDIKTIRGYQQSTRELPTEQCEPKQRYGTRCFLIPAYVLQEDTIWRMPGLGSTKSSHPSAVDCPTSCGGHIARVAHGFCWRFPFPFAGSLAGPARGGGGYVDCVALCTVCPPVYEQGSTRDPRNASQYQPMINIHSQGNMTEIKEGYRPTAKPIPKGGIQIMGRVTDPNNCMPAKFNTKYNAKFNAKSSAMFAVKSNVWLKFNAELDFRVQGQVQSRVQYKVGFPSLIPSLLPEFDDKTNAVPYKSNYEFDSKKN